MLCILLPHFPLACESAANPSLRDRPAAVIHGAGSRKVLLDWSPDLDSLRRDMPLQQAISRYETLEVIPADLPRYRAAFDRVLDGLETITPLVEGDGLEAAWLGIDGLRFIYPDNDRLVGEVRKALPEGTETRIGIAGGKFPSRLAAMQSDPGGYLAVTENDPAWFADISCDVLPVTARVKDRLREFGIPTLGRLAAFPEGPLLSQFGPEGRKLREMAAGRDETPLFPRRWEESLEESTMLGSVTVSLESLLVEMEALLSRVFAGIVPRGLGIHGLVLWTRTWDAEHWERTIKFKEPAMDLRAGAARIKRVLEEYPQPGPVEQIGLRVTRLGYPMGRQRSLFTEVRGRDHLMDDIRQLELRQGGPQVFRIKEVEPWSRIPERRYALMPTGR